VAEYTPNYNLEKQQGNDNVNINGINNNFDIIDAEIKNAHDKADQAFQSASEGKQKIATAITGKGVPTNSSDTFQTMADNIESIETDPSVGTTDAVAADLLSGKKAVSQGNPITGTMPNRGAVNQNLTTEGQEYTIIAGYHNGLGKIKAVINGLVASVIKTGATVGGIAGNFTADATATAAQMLSGVIAYVNGNKITGTIPSKTAQTYTPGTTNQTIAAMQYLSGVQTIMGDANLQSGNIKNGVKIFDKIGTLIEGISLDNVVMHSSNGSDNYEIRPYSLPPVETATKTVNYIFFKIIIGTARTVTSDDDVIFSKVTVLNAITNVIGKSISVTSNDYALIVFNPRKANVTIPHNGSNFNIYKYIE